MKRIKDCSAVCCYNDQIAVKVIKVLEKNDISVPDDISVTGMDNSTLAELCIPPLTSVYNPISLLGETAAKNLLSLIEDPSFNAEVLFRPVVIERSSVAVHTQSVS